MAYILIFYIFLPSLNNNTIFIFSSYFIKHTLASFIKFFCISATRASLGYINRLNLARFFSHRPASTLTTPLQDWSPPSPLRLLDVPPMPSLPLLFLYRLARVHQEDRSSSLARSRPLLKNVLTNAPSVSSQHFGCPSHLTTQDVLSKCTPKNVLSKCTV